MALLSFEHVDKSHRDGRQRTPVLRDVCLEIDPGDFVGLWGMRRSGKTTVLRLAAGVEQADEGTVRFAGADIGRLSGERRARLLRDAGVGLVCTDRRPSLNQTALEHVALPLLSAGVSLREAREPARRALSRAGVVACGETSVLGLPRDALIRVMLAQALVHEPRLLLVDEPAAFLNMREAAEIFALLQSIGRDRAVALVIASEDLRALRNASRIMSVGGGSVHLMDEQGEVLRFPGREAR